MKNVLFNSFLQHLGLQCSVDGICTFSVVVESSTASSELDCLNQCKEIADCNWYSYDKSDNACLLLGNCEELDDTGCTSCNSGQKPCSDTDDGSDNNDEVTKILVVGGLGGPVSSVELIYLNSDTVCDFRSSYPFPITSATGALFQGNRPIVCGGDTQDDESNAITDCMEYFDTDNWTLVDEMAVAR